MKRSARERLLERIRGLMGFPKGVRGAPLDRLRRLLREHERELLRAAADAADETMAGLPVRHCERVRAAILRARVPK